MKLLILTQRVDRKDDNLGFFYDWIAEFSKQCEQVIVICLWAGEHDLPDNVKVFSLGKEKGKGRIKILSNFYKYIYQERKNYDSVLVHMNQVYVVLGGLFWRMWNKKISLWFTHKSVNFSLRIAERLVHTIFTASKESFRLKSRKVQVLGHGVDVDKFTVPAGWQEVQSVEDKFKIITVGRISPSKDYDTLIDAIGKVRDSRFIKNMQVKIIGGSGLADQQGYFEKLKARVIKGKLDSIIEFVGPVSADRISEVYGDADLFVHMSQTGSLDKVVLEAMASCVPIVSCNDAVVNDVLGKYKDKLSYGKKSSSELAEKIKYIYNLKSEERGELGKKLREMVVKNHSLNALIKKILGYL